MDKEALYTVEVNGLIVEIYDYNSEKEFWGDKKIYIYDCMGDLSGKEQDSIIDYLYNEGFVEDRRTECEIVRGEDFF